MLRHFFSKLTTKVENTKKAFKVNKCSGMIFFLAMYTISIDHFMEWSIYHVFISRKTKCCLDTSYNKLFNDTYNQYNLCRMTANITNQQLFSLLYGHLYHYLHLYGRWKHMNLLLVNILLQISLGNKTA